METFEAITRRRSIRKYLKKPVPKELIRKVMTAAIWAPSGSNSQPWRFYVATESKRDELVHALIEASGPHAPNAEEYDKLVWAVELERAAHVGSPVLHGVGIGPVSRTRGMFAHFGSFRFYDAPVAIIVTKPKRLEQGTSDQSIGAAVQNILLAAHSEGLGTCWLAMPLTQEQAITQILGIPDDEKPVAAIALGYPDSQSPLSMTVMPRRAYDDVVIMK